MERSEPPDRVPPLARPFVAVLIGLMVASALFAWEPWPLTSFRLFSQLRHDEQTAWQATAVRSDGEEVAFPIGAYDRGLRGFGFVIAEFAGADAARQDEICRTWVTEAPPVLGVDTGEVRLYQRRWRLSDRSGDRAVPGRREHRYTCTRAGAHDAG